MNHLLRRAGWWIRDYAYAIAWQARAAVDHTDPESFAVGTRVPIIVLPGVYETWQFMRPLVTAMHQQGHPVHIVTALHRNRRPIVELAQDVTGFLEDADLRDVIIVAHSKGGLAGKLAMTGPAGERVRSMLAIATPFGGSRYARLMPWRTLRAFSPFDPGIVELARQQEANTRIVSIYPRFDPHIPEGSELPGAKNVALDVGGHFWVLEHPRVLAELAVLAE
ncbi:esterase/lipase family protein [Microbacterium sp. NPDC056234]|uniref:esterase/lipase family protein n=1 Tax=Microbacterium sp. NPDC056234 TaxID=3345757 RepID=UPI0035DA0640